MTYHHGIQHRSLPVQVHSLPLQQAQLSCVDRLGQDQLSRNQRLQQLLLLAAAPRTCTTLVCSVLSAGRHRSVKRALRCWQR